MLARAWEPMYAHAANLAANQALIRAVPKAAVPINFTSFKLQLDNNLYRNIGSRIKVL
jgi:hypothetical protein